MPGRYNVITTKKVFDNENLAATAVIYTDPIKVPYGNNFSFIIEVSGTAPHAKLEYQICASTQDDINLVSTSSDGDKIWYTPKSNGEIKSDVSASYADGFDPITTKWLRFAITGLGTNHATDTYVTMYILYQ